MKTEISKEKQPKLSRTVDPQYTINLLENPLLKRIIQSKLYPGALQFLTALVFIVVLYQLLAGTSTAHDNFGTAMTWIFWWPIIPLLFLLLGRFWCAICPFATLSDLIQKIVGLNKPVPRFLKKYGMWLIDAFFILITWADHTFGIVENPRGSGVLLLLIILGVVFAGAFYERRTWCRYLCFLGGLSGNYSRAGALELRATPEVCAKCKLQACYKGSEKAPGCPMFEFPRTMESNARCNLCGYCVKSCPNGSIRISPRIPTRELWFIRRPKFEEAFLAVVIMGIVFIQNITMLDIWNGILDWLEQVTGTSNYFVIFSMVFLVAMMLPILTLFLTGFVAKLSNGEGLIANFTRFGYALIPLDLSAHLAHNMFHFLAEGKSVLFTALGLFGTQTHGSTALLDNATIQVLQYLFILIGSGGSIYAVYRIAKSHLEEKSKLWGTFAPFTVLILVLGVINAILFYLPMEMRM